MQNLQYKKLRGQNQINSQWNELLQQINSLSNQLTHVRQNIQQLAVAGQLLRNTLETSAQIIQTANKKLHLPVNKPGAPPLNTENNNPAKPDITQNTTQNTVQDTAQQITQNRTDTSNKEKLIPVLQAQLKVLQSIRDNIFQLRTKNKDEPNSDSDTPHTFDAPDFGSSFEEQEADIEALTQESLDSLDEVEDKADEAGDNLGDNLAGNIEKIQKITALATNALNAYTAIQISNMDAVIARQEKNVAKASELAEKGAAEQLQIEEERLEKLQAQREQFVRQQQALAVLELVANSAVAVAKAAAEGGIAAPFTIAATLIALAVGLAQAKTAAQSAIPVAEKGGVAGANNLHNNRVSQSNNSLSYSTQFQNTQSSNYLRQGSNWAQRIWNTLQTQQRHSHLPLNVAKGGMLSGKRHSQGGILIEAEAGERIFDRQTSLRNQKLFQFIADNPLLDPILFFQNQIAIPTHFPALKNQLFNPVHLDTLLLAEKGITPATSNPKNTEAASTPNNNSWRAVLQELQNLKSTIEKQQRMTVTIDERGIYAITQYYQNQNQRIRNLTR